MKNSSFQAKSVSFLFSVIFLSLSIFAQQVAEESNVINIEVPVRVFKGDVFVDNLTIKDFEVFEDGKRQNVEAVYLIKKRTVERSEEKKRFSPQTTRNFYLYFQITDYSPKLGQAISYFVNEILSPGDILTVITPLKTYRLRSKALEVKSHKEIIGQLKGILRKDALISSSEYRHTIFELENLAKSMTAEVELDEQGSVSLVTQELMEEPGNYSTEVNLLMYHDLLKKLENIRRIDQNALLEFSDILKKTEGQKYVFMFYQKEFIPEIGKNVMDYYRSKYQDRQHLLQMMSDIFDFYHRDITFDVDLVKKHYADSSISIHFMFFPRPKSPVYGINFVEHSEDIFSAFREMARAGGGYTESSANPEQMFKNAVAASENYYLLYYSPQAYVKDGKFRNIQVKVKHGKYRLTYRMGYYAN